MKKYQVELTGVAPLLQNKFNVEAQVNPTSTRKKKVYVPEEEAEKCLYRNSDKQIYVPSEHVLGSMIRAAGDFKVDRFKNYKNVIKSGILVSPDAILLGKDTWDEIDVRRAVIGRAGVVKWRPKFNDWKISFEITVIADDLLDSRTLKEILETAGATQGIGDYRPRFGRFMVTKFTELK